ncbi:MAG TPA: STAS domain-containing protein [Candidatus Rubrimentiphilum sp.]|nr:STAS domain-containing protein [Candidatus Rubrimentiphilum sp.]
MAIAREFAFHGEFDISQKAAIERRFEPMRETGSPALILDLTDVRYLDTTFLNAMVAFQKWAVTSNTDSRLCVAAGRNLSRIFHITALDSIFPVFATMTLAREYATLPR